MILNISKPIPAFVQRAIEKCDFVEGTRKCQIDIKEEDAFTYIHSESFNFSDVYGNCEFAQLEYTNSPVFVVKFEFEKNIRSFDFEAAEQQDGVLRG
jgi:hypothetical protein